MVKMMDIILWVFYHNKKKITKLENLGGYPVGLQAQWAA